MVIIATGKRSASGRAKSGPTWPPLPTNRRQYLTGRLRDALPPRRGDHCCPPDGIVHRWGPQWRRHALATLMGITPAPSEAHVEPAHRWAGVQMPSGGEEQTFTRNVGFVTIGRMLTVHSWPTLGNPEQRDRGTASPWFPAFACSRESAACARLLPQPC